MDRRVDREEKAAIAKAQTQTGQARGKALEEKITKAVKAGKDDARKHQYDHPDRWRDFVWDGSTPDWFVREVRKHFGAGLAWYTWGGMEWYFTVTTPNGRVKVEYGDRVFVLDDGMHVEKGR